jgi:hypothetical protein
MRQLVVHVLIGMNLQHGSLVGLGGTRAVKRDE